MLQLFAAIADDEAVGHLPGDEIGQVLHEGLFEDLGGAAGLRQGSRQGTQEAAEICIVLHHCAQRGFADVAALEELLHEADGGFLVALEVRFDLQGGVASVHAVQLYLDGVELAQP